MLRLTKKLNDALERRVPVVQCTVIETRGSTPLKAGAKMLVFDDGEIFGTIGGGNIEKQVMDDALEILKSSDPVVKEYNLLQQQMCCGGVMKIFIEPMKRPRQLIIFGAGHVGSAVASFAQALDFKIILVDEREEILNKINLSTGKIAKNHREAFPEITFDTDTFILVCTHLHEYDREILAYCIQQPHAYLGMIGSKRKVIVTRKRFLLQQIATEAQLDEVDMPVGFDIGQNSPSEIALGIIAKIVAIANGKELRSPKKITEYEETGVNSNGCG